MQRVFELTPRPATSPERRRQISAKLIAQALPFIRVQPQAGYQFCEHCKTAIEVSDRKYCFACLRMIADREIAEAFHAETVRNFKILALFALVGGLIIAVTVYLSR